MLLEYITPTLNEIKYFYLIGYTFYRYGNDYGTDPRGFVGWDNDTKACMFVVMIPASLVR